MLAEKEKITKCCAKYNIQYYEIKQWIQANVEDSNEPIHQWDMQQLQEGVKYERWKNIIKDIKSE